MSKFHPHTISYKGIIPVYIRAWWLLQGGEAFEGRGESEKRTKEELGKLQNSV